MAFAQSSVDYMLDCMTTHYHSMLLLDSRFTLSEDYLFLDFCINFLTRSGFVVFYDEVSMRYKLA